MKKYIVLLAAILAVAATSVSVASSQPSECGGGETLFGGECIPNGTHFDICHVAGLASDPANYIDLNIPIVAIVGGHFGENGTQLAGHEQDSFGVCEPPDPPDVEISAQAAATQPTCENDGLAALSFGNENGVQYSVEGNVAPGQTVSVSAQALLGFLLIGASEFEFTFDSFDAEACNPDDPDDPDNPEDPDSPEDPDTPVDSPNKPNGPDKPNSPEREGEVPHTL